MEFSLHKLWHPHSFSLYLMVDNTSLELSSECYKFYPKAKSLRKPVTGTFA